MDDLKCGLLLVANGIVSPEDFCKSLDIDNDEILETLKELEKLSSESMEILGSMNPLHLRHLTEAVTYISDLIEKTIEGNKE